MDPIIIPLLTAVIAGGFASEVFRYFTQKKKGARDLQVADLSMFYPTWKEEIERLHNEVSLLRRDILALSAEIHRLGGDPLAVRYGQHTQT